MSTWILDITTDLRARSVIGTGADLEACRRLALRAVGDINAVGGFHRPRYQITIDGSPIAIISTGLDTSGLPDQRGVATLVRRLLDDGHSFDP